MFVSTLLEPISLAWQSLYSIQSHSDKFHEASRPQSESQSSTSSIEISTSLEDQSKSPPLLTFNESLKRFIRKRHIVKNLQMEKSYALLDSSS